jgi:hypothetical protein
VGAAYLREASGVMREQLLPAAVQLFEAVSDELDEARGSAGTLPAFSILLGLALLGTLVLVQTRLTRRTNRVFNLGLVVASAAALASLLWLTFSWASAASHLDASERDGSAQVALLSDARIAALQARSDEAHTLVARGGSLGEGYEEEYQALLARLTGEDATGTEGLLAEAREQATEAPAEAAAGDAIDAAVQWQEIHTEVRRLDEEEGDYGAAVALAVGLEEDSAGSAFGRLDRALADGIGHGTERLLDEAVRAGNALTGVGIGLGLLTALLLAGVVVGIQQRIAEYR